MSNLNIEYNLNFANVEYILYLSVLNDCLKLNLEQIDESMYWKAEFEAKYIEEITNKAGSYKSFQIFIKMLMSALSKESESVFIDLLSFRDLEQIKMKKMQGNSLRESFNSNESQMNFNKINAMNNSNSNSLNDINRMNKRYFIISFSNEFEKVHYPLPLQYISTPENEMLIRTIQRMKKNIQTNTSNTTLLKNSGFNLGTTLNFKELDELKTENHKLKNTIKLLESQRKLGAVDNEEVFRIQHSLKEEYEKYKIAAENKIKLLAQTVEELKNKINSTTQSNPKENDHIVYIKELEAKLEKASEIVVNERKQGQSFIDEKIREIEKLKKEIFSYKEDEKKYKVKINQLEKDLEIANKRNIYEMNNIKNKNYNSSLNSKKSYTTNSVKSNYSNISSKRSETNSTSSNVKKNLQANPYNKYKGLYNKNYSPFQFFDKNKNKSKNSSVKSKSVKSVKSNSSAISKGSNNFTISSKKAPSNYTSNLSNKTKSTTKKSLTNNQVKSYIPKVYTNKNNKMINNNNKFSQINYKYNSVNNLNKNSVLSDKNNNSTVKTNNFINRNNLVEEKIKIINRLKADGVSNPINPNDINERLGRIQNLLDSAKV